MKTKFGLFFAVLALGFGTLAQAANNSGTTVTATDTGTTIKTEGAAITADDEGTTITTNALPEDGGDTTKDTPAEEKTMTSAPDANLAASQSPKVKVGSYQEIPCDKAFFTENSCNQCFEGGSRKAGERLTGFTDTWTNPNTSEQVIYKDEQKWPELVNLGGDGTVFLSNPPEPDKFWKYSDEVTWTDATTGSGKQEYLLEGGKTINFLEGDLGATYLIKSTNKKEGEPIGLLKFYLNYHDTDQSANELPQKTHIECVAFKAGAAAPVAPIPVPPKEVTKVKTGPESYAIVLAALIIAYSIVRFRRIAKR